MATKSVAAAGFALIEHRIAKGDRMPGDSWPRAILGSIDSSCVFVNKVRCTQRAIAVGSRGRACRRL